MILKVKRGGSILGPAPKRIHYGPGKVIPESVLTGKQIEEHVRSGYLTVVRSSGEIVPTLAEVKAAGYSEEAADGIIAEAKKRAEAETSVVENPPGVDGIPGISETGQPVKVKSRWCFDPDGLRGVDLDQLNVMILERDNSQEEFATEEEAIAWLSQDYEEPKA